MKSQWVGILAGVVLCTGPARAADYLAYNGEKIYRRFCASCHGIGGAGDGPVASSLKVEVPDLRLLARRRGGKFPTDQVARIIDGRFMIAVHGTRTMPIWGEDFSRIEPGNPDAEQTTQMLVKRLTQYLESLQLPAGH